MVKYTILADVVEGEIQNLQEWTKAWGEIEHEINQLDGEILEAYAVLGDYDFQITYVSDDEEAAIQIAVALERHGLDTRTHQLLDIDRVGRLVDDI